MYNKLENLFKNDKIKGLNLNKEDLCSDLDTSALLAKSYVPYSHRRIADNYVILRRICPFQVVQPRISKVEESLLMKYQFKTLEHTTITRANEEISLLKEWATSTDDTLRLESEELLSIRVKELKFILSDNYAIKSDEMNKGYKSIETYLTSVTKYYNT